MSKKKNNYEKKAMRKELLSGFPSPAETKGNITGTLLSTGKDILVGAVGGGLAGAIVGRGSFLMGLVVTGAGHYIGQPSMTAFGVGMMSSSGYQALGGGLKGLNGLEGVKERVQAFSHDFKKRLFLDKVIKSKKPADDMNGMGEVQYYAYPELQGRSEEDVLDQIEQQIASSAQVGVGEIAGTPMMGVEDILERNL
jgi:hypothetical protein